MKKLSKINVLNADIMSESEMKLVVGGATNCSTTCSNGTSIRYTDCLGTCIAIDGQSVTCKGDTITLEKRCGGNYG